MKKLRILKISREKFNKPGTNTGFGDIREICAYLQNKIMQLQNYPQEKYDSQSWKAVNFTDFR